MELSLDKVIEVDRRKYNWLKNNPSGTFFIGIYLFMLIYISIECMQQCMLSKELCTIKVKYLYREGRTNENTYHFTIYLKC